MKRPTSVLVTSDNPNRAAVQALISRSYELHAKKKTAAELKRTVRENKRKAGFVCKQIWIRPHDWPKVRAYLAKFA